MKKIIIIAFALSSCAKAPLIQPDINVYLVRTAGANPAHKLSAVYTDLNSRGYEPLNYQEWNNYVVANEGSLQCQANYITCIDTTYNECEVIRSIAFIKSGPGIDVLFTDDSKTEVESRVGYFTLAHKK